MFHLSRGTTSLGIFAEKKSATACAAAASLLAISGGAKEWGLGSRSRSSRNLRRSARRPRKLGRHFQALLQQQRRVYIKRNRYPFGRWCSALSACLLAVLSLVYQ